MKQRDGRLCIVCGICGSTPIDNTGSKDEQQWCSGSLWIFTPGVGHGSCVEVLSIFLIHVEMTCSSIVLGSICSLLVGCGWWACRWGGYSLDKTHLSGLVELWDAVFR